MPVSGLSDATYAQASAAEREASKRIEIAGKQVDQAQRQVNESLSEIRDAYDKESLTQSARNENALETQKLKGYEEVRDLQRAQQAELRKLRRTGEQDLTGLQDHYRTSVFSAERDGQEHLTEIQKQNTQQLAFTQQNQQSELEDHRSQHELQMAQQRQTSDEQLKKLSTDTRAQYEKMKTGHEQANEQTQKNFDTQYRKIHTETADTLGEIQAHAGQQLRAIREDTAYKLAAYRSRQSDPFYDLLDIHARIQDEGSSYLLTARIPEYEQKHISVSIKGDNLVVTGNRRNEEDLELDQGHSIGSASFQSFHESFPLSWPVDAARLTKTFDGDELIVRVPKKNEFAFKAPVPKRPEKIRADVPHFPENIRHAPPSEHSEPPPQPLKKEKGSGSLL